MKRNKGSSKGVPANQYAQGQTLDMMNAGDRVSMPMLISYGGVVNREQRRQVERAERRATKGQG